MNREEEEKETDNQRKSSTIKEKNNINKSSYKIEKSKSPGDYAIKKGHIKSIGLAIIPLLVLAGMIYFLYSPYSQSLINNTGIPSPQITFEKIEFHNNQIIASIRNTGSTEIIISQADVNDRIQAAAIEPSKILQRLSEAKVIIPFLWNSGEPYEIGITTSDGVRFSKTIQAAAATPIPDVHQLSVFAILGSYVGVIPIMIGLVWYPFMRKLSTNQYNFFLSLTAGLLVFLGIDALIESNEIVTDNLASVFNGQILVFIVSVASFLVLYYVSERFSKRAIEKLIKKSSIFFSSTGNSLKDNSITTTTTNNMSNTKNQQIQLTLQQQLIKPLAISMMILLGKVALSTFLIVGFTLHNTTEGLAIVAPLAKTGKLMIKRLLLMGIIAGIPTILGAWVGGFIYSPIAAIVFLSIGAGAIFQVVYSLGRWMKNSVHSNDNNLQNNDKSISNDVTTNPKPALSSASIIVGFIVGMIIMYMTGLLV